MANDFTIEDISLLGYATPEKVHDSAGFRVFDARVSHGIENIHRRFIYLKARCTPEEADLAAGFITENTSVLRAPRSTGLSRFSHRLRNAPILVQEDLVWDVLSNSFADYLDRLSSELPKEDFFISPRSVERDIEAKLVDRLLRYLRAGGSESSDDGILQVLASNAGVGKTTLSRHLIQRLVDGRAKTIPVYVESEHWQKLNLSSVDDLWDVIDNSMRTFAPRSPLNEQLFRHALRQGYICFVFDGFDELCGLGGAPFDPVSVLHDLNSIVSASEARVLLTTRSLFWDARITHVPDNVRVWTLDAFNRHQARDYFRKVFASDKTKANRANEVYTQLLHAAQPPEHSGSVRDQFVNLPLCVRMVADYVRDGGTHVSEVEVEHPVLQHFLTDICEREVRRQNLRTSAARQLASFQDVALSYDGVNPTFPLPDLLLLPAGVDEQDLDRMADHALIRAAPGSLDDRYRFRYDFIGPFFRASALALTIRREEYTAFPASTKSVMSQESDGKGPVLEQLRYFLGPVDFDTVIAQARRAMGHDLDAASFLFHLGLSIINGDRSLLTSGERARRLFSAMSGATQAAWSGTVSDWQFRGPLARLSLKGIRFSGCRFLDCSFKHCEVDRTTTFEDCVFEGNQAVEGGGQWEQISVKGQCRFVYPADTVWEPLLRRRVGDYSERVSRTLELGLRKFWRQGRVSRSVALPNWNTGMLGQSGQAKLALDAMLAGGFVSKIRIAGVGEGGVALTKEAVPDLQNYMDNKRIVGRVEEVYKRLLTAAAKE